MTSPQALVADFTPAMCGLIRDMLRQTGYEVSKAGTAPEVAASIHRRELISADAALLVICAKLATQSAVPISVAASQRWQLELPPFKLIVLFEWGTLGTLARPALHHCELLAVLEKPFHMHELEQLAQLALTKVA